MGVSCVRRAAKGEGEGTYPNHRTERIANDEEGEPEQGFDGRDVEFGFDTLEAGGVDCGADVYRGCEEADLEGDEKFFGGGPISRVTGVVGGPGDEEVVCAFFLVCEWGFLWV